MDIAGIVPSASVIARTTTARPKDSFGDRFRGGLRPRFRNIHTPASRPVRRGALARQFSTAESSLRRQRIETPQLGPGGFGGVFMELIPANVSCFAQSEDAR